jgi:predicted permease
MADFVHELRLALRALGRAPSFTVVAVITLALGIGAVASVFSVADGVLLRPLPYPEAEGLVRLYSDDPKEGDRESLSGADFMDIQAAGGSFADVAALRRLDFNLVGADRPLRVTGASVTPNLFALLGVDAALGRTLSPEADTPAAPRAIVLGHDLWQSRFGGRREVLGEGLQLNDELYTVVGVMPRGFEYPRHTALWASPRYRVPDPPFDLGGDPAGIRGAEYLSVVGRLREGCSLEAAQAEMDALALRIAEQFPSAEGEGIAVVPLHEDVVGDARALLLLLLGAVGFLLLIACANVASLLVVRASRREREIAVRMALGARRLHLVRQLLSESLLLALAGGVLGFILALWGTEALLALAPEGLPRIGEIGIDLRVLGFVLVVVLGTGILFGLAPVPQVLHQDLRTAASEGGGGSTARGGRSRLRRALIVSELAVSFVLLMGAGLMIRTFTTLVAVDPGFDARDTLVAHLSLPESRYSSDHDVVGFHRRVLEGVEALPGVESAGMVLTLPMRWNLRGTLRFHIEGRPTEEGEGPVAGFQLASPGYFSALRIPLVRGRLLADADDAHAPSVAVVNEAFAEVHFPGEDPIGRRIAWGDPEADDVDWARIVGIVGDTRLDGLDRPAVPEAFHPYAQGPLNFATLVVRSTVERGALQTALRRVVAEVDPQQPLHGVMSMEEVLAASLGERRFTMTLLAVFATVALVMAAVGLYGVVSYSVAQQSREIGIRRALGAQAGTVMSQVLREGTGLVALGLGLGALGGLVLTRVVASQVHGVSVTDPVSYGAGCLVLGSVAFVSCLVPAVRASRVDPATILRDE